MTTPSAQTEKRTPLKLPNNQEVITKLVNELEEIFTKEKLGNYPQLVFKMNKSLEIPITALYKEKKISAITTNLILIREALKVITKVTYDAKREIIHPNFKALKNILIVHHLNDDEKEKFLNILSDSPEYKRKISENYFDSTGGYSLVLRTEEDAESLCKLLKEQNFKSRQLEIFVEQENLYLTFLQKAQDATKYSYQTYGYGYGQMDPSTYYQNYYYFANMHPMYYPPGYGYGAHSGDMGGYDFEDYPGQGKYHEKKGRGNYMQKEAAQYDEYQDDAEEEEEEKKGDSYRGEGYSRSRGSKYHKKKGHAGAAGQRQYREYEKKSPNRQNEAHRVSPEKKEDIIKRTRINSENFPPLSKEGDRSEIGIVSTDAKRSGLKHGATIIHLSKAEIVKAFEELQNAGTLKINPSLISMNEETVPVLEKKVDPSLEVLTPKFIVKETRPKRRTIQEEIVRSPHQGGVELSQAPQNQHKK